MKVILLVLLTMLLCFFTAPHTYAAFPVKTHSTGNTATANTATANTATTASHKHPFKALKELKKMALPPDGERTYKTTGWPGIVALICAILALPFYAAGLFGTFILFAIGAIVFGAIGMGKSRHTNTGLAIAGLAMGIVELTLLLLLAIIVAAILL